MTPAPRHVVLLGDSIFANGRYTSGAPDVAGHLRHLLPRDWAVTLRAEDGARVQDLAAQLRRVPQDASDLIISVGGNDALRNVDLLLSPARTGADVLGAFAERLTPFERAYRAAITQAVGLRRFTALCTIYNGAVDAARAPAARMALTLFNDVVLRTAIDLHLDGLELRSICTEDADYTNVIEPSGQGGLKIARGITALLTAGDSERQTSRWWGQVPG